MWQGVGVCDKGYGHLARVICVNISNGMGTCGRGCGHVAGLGECYKG